MDTTAPSSKQFKAPRKTKAPSTPVEEPVPKRSKKLPPEANDEPKKSKNGLRLRNFVFTINNYTEDDWNWFQTNHGNPTYLIVAKEVGEQGTPHLQGAMCLGRQVAFSTVKKWGPFQRSHIEPMRGTPEDSQRYCRKDGNFFEIGSPPGSSKPIDDAISAIREGKSLRELASDPVHSKAIVFHNRGLTTLRSLLAKPRDSTHPPKVYWFYGPTGTNKTRSAFELGVHYTGLSSEIWISDDPKLQWFDGYCGQKVAIIDDFRPKSVKFNFLLRLLDRYPLNVQFKGGFTTWSPDIIIITTPNTIDDTFVWRGQHLPEDIKQLTRRVSLSLKFGTSSTALHFSALLASLPRAVSPSEDRAHIPQQQQQQQQHGGYLSLSDSLGSGALCLSPGSIGHSGELSCGLEAASTCSDEGSRSDLYKTRDDYSGHSAYESD